MKQSRQLHILRDQGQPGSATGTEKISHYQSDNLPLKTCRFSSGSHETEGVHSEAHMLALPVRSDGYLELEIGSERAAFETNDCPLSFSPVNAMSHFCFTGWTDNIVVSIDAGYVSTLAERWGSRNISEKLEPCANLNAPRLSYIIRQIYRDFTAEDASSRLSSEAFTIQMAVELFRYFSTPTFGNEKVYGKNISIQQVKDYIEDNLEADISVSDLAALVGLDIFMFSRLFKEQTGQSPRQYIIKRRVDRACVLLADENRSLAEIAYSCGFSSQSHMTTTFAHHIGVTPGRYRRDLKI
ncbi:MAG: AraC family transcriptional regulator [Pseudomonadota bacterium]